MSNQVTVPLWKPDPARVDSSNMSRFMRFAARHLSEIQDYSSLYRWSIERPLEFWPAVWEFCEVRSQGRGDVTAVDFDLMPGARWFPGARLNFAENLLRCQADRPALVGWSEAGPGRRLSYPQLRDEVERLASGLRRLGVEAGDRVVGYMPNRPEAVTAMLAASSLGAIWSSCSPDFGIKGVLDRFGQIRPKVLFCADGYSWGGKRVETLERTARLLERLPEVEATIVVPSRGDEADVSLVPGGIAYQDFLDSSPSRELSFEALPFDHPLYIMYSSGTTGLPKCMVHGSGGTLLQHLKELVLHCDLKEGDRIFYYTTCGWMMWNWLVSGLAVGATVVLYDGSPFLPRKEILFDLAERERISIFGVSAKYLALADKKGIEPRASHDLGSLESILSTGSPLAPESYDYVYRDVKKDVRLSSISGGTDIISCFALGNPIAPVQRGELQCLGLGMKVEVFDEDGTALPPGRQGELVCTQPFPSMPVSFWDDPEGEKYRAAYFDRFPGVWRHGDWVERTVHGGLVIHGRSDATLNPGGVRIGTAEIYRQVEQLEEVLESVVVGQEWGGDVRIVLFVRLVDGLELNEGLRARIRSQIRRNTSSHHVPKKILQVTDIPRTISGKISELAVRNVVHGRPVRNVDALANPESLDLFRGRPELENP